MATVAPPKKAHGAAHIRPYRRGGTSAGIIHPKFISTRSAGAWPSTIKLSIIRLSVPTCHWLSPSLLGPGGDAQLHPRVARLAWNMLAISVEFEASVSEQRATFPEIVCCEAIVPPFETSFQVTTCPTGIRRNLRLPDCVGNSRRRFRKTGDLAMLLHGSTS